MLLFVIICKILGDSVSAISSVLELCFSESSRVVVEFRRALQSTATVSNRGPSSRQTFLDTLLSDLNAMNRFALLRAMSKSVNRIFIQEIQESEFLEAFVEDLAASAKGASQMHCEVVYCIEIMATIFQAYAACLHDLLVKAPLLSRDILFQLMDISLENLDCQDLYITRTCQSFLNCVIDVSMQQDKCFGMGICAPERLLSAFGEMHKSKKSKYRLLSILLQYVDASDILTGIPDYIENTIRAVAVDKGVRKPAILSLKAIWKSLHQNFDHETQGEQQTRNVLDIIVSALIDTNELIRVSTLTNILPGLMQECPHSFLYVLHALLDRQGIKGWLGSCLGLLTAGKKFSNFTNLESLENKGIGVYDLLERAIKDKEERVQISALQLLVEGNANKTIDVPNERILNLTWMYYNMAMRCVSPLAKQENISCYGKLLARIKVSVAATLTRPENFDQDVHNDARLCEIWIQSICRLCISCLHPGGTHGKRFMAIEILCKTMEAFDTLIDAKGSNHVKCVKRRGSYIAILSKDEIGQGLKYGAFSPFPAELFSRGTSNLLYSALTDAYEHIRVTAMAILLMIQRDSIHMNVVDLHRLSFYALDLLQRPRLADMEGGSMMLGIIYKKYIATGSYSINLTSLKDIKVTKYTGESPSTFIKQIIELTKFEVSSVGTSCSDLSAFSRTLSGLTSLKHLLDGISYHDIKDIMGSLTAVLDQASKLIIPVLTSPEQSIFDMEIEEESLVSIDNNHLLEEQILRNKAWMISKEMCSVIETVWEVVSNEPIIPSSLMAHLNSCTDMIIEILLEAKHYGTIDYSRATLQKICSIKLTGVDTSTAVMKRMFDHLLRDGQSRRDAIRRSGGLPFGIHSTMVANPKSRLTIETMNRLIDIYQEKNGTLVDSIWPKVHTLNTLRPIFSDHRLAALEQFYGKCFKIILSGLSDSSWEIRNSAALSFTALVSRVMGFANVRRENHIDLWPQRSPTAKEFFDKYKDVERFILDRLQAYGSIETKPGNGDSLLAPVLGLLGRLRPLYYKTEKDEYSGNIQAYAYALIRISESREIKIRKMASRAFVSVVPMHMWSGFCRQHSECISTMLSLDDVPWNAIHGRLCTITEVLKATYSLMEQNEDIDHTTFSGIGQSICDEIHAGLLPLMAACPPVGAEFLKVCLLLCRLDHAYPDERVFEFISKDVINVMWKPIMSMGLVDNMMVPMLAICLKRMIKLAFIWCFPKMIEQNKNTSYSRYLECIRIHLTHPYYEVREAALKSLLHSFTMIHGSTVDKANVTKNLGVLYKLIRDSWEHEPAYKSRYLMISVLNMYHANAWEVCLEQGVVSIGAASIELYSSNPAMLSQVILAYAYSVSSEHSNTSLLNLLRVYGKPEHSEEIRMACVQSMGITQALVLTPKDAYIEEYTDFWNVACMLLEDEDMEVRSEMSRVIQKSMKGIVLEDMRVEHVQEIVVPWLGPVLGSHPACIDQLQSWICTPSEDYSRCILEFESRKHSKLFLVEKANQHEDPLVYVNLASSQLARLNLGPRAQETSSWLDVCSKSLLKVLEYFEELERRDPDAVLKYLDMFASHAYQHMYRLWAGMWSSSHACTRAGLALPESTLRLHKKIENLESVILAELFHMQDLSVLISKALNLDSHTDKDVAFSASSRFQIQY